uniref:Nuclear receptor interacting protein 2 n=1 Tax=Neogobius melanostomus TaxID=47308 RepID=A0A8C6UJP4_9GOBI
MSEAKKGELAIRDKAILHQQRRLKQATQFTHKDSADLLPLDGLKRLGTSKDLQPHSIVQRRLLEGNITRLKGEAWDPNARVRSPLADANDKPTPDAEERSESTADDSTEERESLEESEKSLRSDEDDDSSEVGCQTKWKMTRTHQNLLLSSPQCCETEVRASINTGSQHNHISNSCSLILFIFALVLCLFPDDETFELCLGLQTLMELKCCVDFDCRVLKLQGSGEELPFLDASADAQCHHDSNKTCEPHWTLLSPDHSQSSDEKEQVLTPKVVTAFMLSLRHCICMTQISTSVFSSV